jgi:uncharacterized membrane protein
MKNSTKQAVRTLQIALNQIAGETIGMFKHYDEWFFTRNLLPIFTVMRTINLNVTIAFTEKITTDEDLQIIVDNVLAALVKHTNESGITPDGSDAVTRRITVAEPYSSASAKHIFVKDRED